MLRLVARCKLVAAMLAKRRTHIACSSFESKYLVARYNCALVCGKRALRIACLLPWLRSHCCEDRMARTHLLCAAKEGTSTDGRQRFGERRRHLDRCAAERPVAAAQMATVLGGKFMYTRELLVPTPRGPTSDTSHTKATTDNLFASG